MLEELMRECRNWFVAPNGVHLGTFTVKEGSIALPFLVYGQYFRIVGSVFNDGVYEYGNVYLQDETFEGAIWALSVPPAFIKLSEEIKSATSTRTPQTALFKVRALRDIVTPNRARTAILAAL